ncbi:helix-turn-helix domain-containing protein [Marinobacterium sp. D7]|uniref:helix-turn-helix transcriptional regulator n=1 Tax=Marinobacterium ramblicola TaxID=2849041 RepID=UPI001C2D04BD|nr:DNA-binding response regulator [Marinobacterium ramblicola]MBV1786944.1 helix-turn-helix domain-containing protein [Marinobacterium ramblicola]
MSQRCKSPVLWIDLRSSERSATLLELFRAAFQIENLDPHNPVFDHRRITPCAICFDFDYPDMHGLTLMRELHERHPLLPIIMMTEQHSESLMVWALRVRVWEILLKPMARSAAEYQIGAISRCIEEAAQDPTALTAASPMLRLPEESRFHGSSLETRAVHPALSYMQLHLGEHITEEQLARFCNMRPLQFSRMFKKAYDVTFQEMLQQLRMKEATRLLENPDLQILDVALTVGYRDHSYFCRVFKKYLGVTPKTYQEQLLSQNMDEQQTLKQAKLYAVANLDTLPPQEADSWSRSRRPG